jgi:hypothetical protein
VGKTNERKGERGGARGARPGPGRVASRDAGTEIHNAHDH